jgi:hypothetical protein
LGRCDIGQFSDITVDPAGTVWVFDDRLGLLRLTRMAWRQWPRSIRRRFPRSGQPLCRPPALRGSEAYTEPLGHLDQIG